MGIKPIMVYLVEVVCSSAHSLPVMRSRSRRIRTVVFGVWNRCPAVGRWTCNAQSEYSDSNRDSVHPKHVSYQVGRYSDVGASLDRSCPRTRVRTVRRDALFGASPSLAASSWGRRYRTAV